MDYQMQQEKLFPLIADIYTIAATSLKVSDLAQENLRRIQENEDFSLLNETHIVISGAKAVHSS